MQYAGEIQKIVDRQAAENKRIASFIHESVMSHAGMVVFPEGFLQFAYKLVSNVGLSESNECVQSRRGRCF